MPLVNCPDCRKDCSTQASFCPNCGRPLQQIKQITPRKSDQWKWGLLAILLGIGYAISHFTSSTSESANNSNSSPSVHSSSLAGASNGEPKRNFDLDLEGQLQRIHSEGIQDSDTRDNILAADTKITYEQLNKNADRYAGKPWAFTGKIIQIQEGPSSTTARISLDGWGSKVIYVKGDFTTDFVENNQAYVVGYLAGNYSYTSQAGWQITIPALAARAILKPSEVTKIKAKKQ